MMTREENDLLTRVGPGTPAGNLLRRYWQPVALSEELPQGGAPKAVRLLGEDLALFRDDQGRPGLLGIHCSHRGADLSYGRIEDGGLRCIYHGWLYDIFGHCLDQPGEPGGGKGKESIRHLAYPCKEIGGLIFTYMGPGGPPLFPNYEIFTVPDNQRYINKAFIDCNYLQANEGNIDPIHLSFLHRIFKDEEIDMREVPGSDKSPRYFYKQDTVPTIDVELTDFGVRIYSARKAGPDKQYLRTSYFVLPNLCAVPGQMQGEGYNMNWHAPIDDEHNWKYTITFSRKRPIAKQSDVGREVDSHYMPIRNRANRYLQDREMIKTTNFSGIGPGFLSQDACATEGPGPIQDRTQEHLVSSDKTIVAARKLLLKAIRDVEEGREPTHVIRDPKLNHFPHLQVISEVIPNSVNVKDYVQRAIQAVEVGGL